ncbi:WAT1-related protein At4g08300-like isoform X2 [Gossypium arboreum]|uniref:WAT1-related protein At4g08300-like isoform X2 n=1 Tax=Gossypium arboreum TaxID=29729 RepID=UPI0022F1B0E9|nr:WAT1-related protein At4g08300-like isoform X2 [Gossypium arboreum]
MNLETEKKFVKKVETEGKEKNTGDGKTMADKSGSSYSDMYRRFKPHILMVLSQFGYTFLYIFTEACFNHGMNPHVHITYRHVVAGIVMFPFAYFLERKKRPKLTFALFLEIFVLSILGVSLTLNMYFVSLRYTSPTFLAALVNTIASLTFIIAVVFRLEVVNLRNPRGIAKVVGTFVSLVGVTTMTLYKGPAVKNLGPPLVQIQGKSPIHENWLKGSILIVASCLTWSILYIMQAFTLKRYPAPLSLTTWMSFVGAAQSAVFTVIVNHKPASWKMGFNIDFWATLYAGVVCSGLIIFIQLWCTEVKGPVFVTMFNPLSTLLVALLGYFVLGERLYMGSILGGAIVIIGLYLVLWGKDRDQEAQIGTAELPYLAYDHKNDTKAHKILSVEREAPPSEP